MKHLKARSPAIRTAIRAYNTAAKAMEPPRIALKAKEVMEHSFIGQFDILRDCYEVECHNALIVC